MFIRNLALFSGVEIAGLAIGLLTSPITTRLLSIQQYGSLPLLAAVWSIATIFQFAGMDSAFVIYQAKGTHARKTVTVTTTVCATLAAGTVWVLFASAGLCAPWLAQYASVSRFELFAFMLGLLPTALVAWHLQLLRFAHEALRFARVTLVGRIASALVAIPVMYVLPQEDRLAGALFASAGLSWLSLALAIYEVRSASGSPFATGSFERKLVRPMLAMGAALIPGAMVYAMCAVTDRLLLGWYSDNAQVAVFGLAGAVASGALILKAAFARTWDPHMIDWIATRDERVYLPRLQAAADLIAPAVLIVTFLALVWGDTVFWLLFPSSYAGSGRVMPVLVLGGTLATLALVAIATETISGRTRYRLAIYIAGLAVNIGVCVNSIPTLGALGAAYGALAGEVTIVCLWVVVGKWLIGNLRLNWTIAGGAVALAAILVAEYRPGRLPFSPVAEQLAASVICAGATWLLIRRARKLFGELPAIPVNSAMAAGNGAGR